MRVLGLDIGKKRIGVAVSDEEGMIAQALTVIEREGAVDRLCQIISLYRPDRIVCGLPFMMDGSIGKEAGHVLSFIYELKEKTKLPVHTYDERLTTKEAEKTLERCRISSRRQRRVIDKISAQLILQGWLERECLKKSK